MAPCVIPLKSAFYSNSCLNYATDLFEVEDFVGPKSILYPTGTLFFGLSVTPPMYFKATVDSSSPVLFCRLCTTFGDITTSFRELSNEWVN